MPSQLRSWVPAGGGFVTLPATQFTLSTQWELENDFDLFRFVYNNNTASAYTLPLAKYALSSAIGNGHSPVNAAGAVDFTLFNTVFYNNAGADIAPLDQTTWGTGTSTLTVAANAGVLAQPTYAFSDWHAANSLARTDGGVRPLLMVRHLTDALGFTVTAAITSASWNAEAGTRPLFGVFQSGVDNVTAPGSMGATPSTLNDMLPVGIQYVARAPGFSLLGVGDSLTKGQGSASTLHSWAYLSALALSSPARPISFWNQGWQGQISTNYIANGYNAFKLCKPDVVTIAVWSPNDGLTQAAADAAWSRAMNLSHYALKSGAVPVLMGPLPWSGITTAPQEAARLSARTRMLQAAAYGFNVLDWEPVMGTGAALNRVQPQLLAGDNQHPNDAGNQLMDTAVFRPVLRSILAL